MSLSWSEKHEQVIEKCLESEEAFKTYLTSSKHPSNVCRAFLAFTSLVNLFSELINKREELEKKVKEHQKARMRIKGALTYVEEQLNTLRAAQVAPTPPVAPTPLIVYLVLPSPALVSVAPVSPTLMPSDHNVPSKPSHSSYVATSKVVRIPDPPIFHVDSAKDTITYRDWHLQMKNKL